ncbi:hypothetical protein RE735_12875 [Bacillus aerius]|uniref:hypothetical protein n=1 Tax=Bacillus aerius TaxID=293388 RepID=UPI00281657A9|nr:hypothetical protein [Bacillus aerius]WMT28018.1 hypothetical protein RE735_12875 [Bacillus aerius]
MRIERYQSEILVDINDWLKTDLSELAEEMRRYQRDYENELVKVNSITKISEVINNRCQVQIVFDHVLDADNTGDYIEDIEERLFIEDPKGLEL